MRLMLNTVSSRRDQFNPINIKVDIMNVKKVSVVFPAFNEQDVPSFTSQDIRFTVKGRYLYAICLGWPKRPITIETLKNLWGPEIISVRMLGVDQELAWSLNEKGMTITPPQQKPCKHAVVFRIERGKVFE